MSWLRMLVGCVACSLVGLMSLSAVAPAEEPSLTAGGSSSLLGNPLVVPGEESLVGGQVAAAELVKQTNPGGSASMGAFVAGAAVFRSALHEYF